MSCWRALEKIQRRDAYPESAGGPEHRVTPRFRCRLVRCSTGVVINASAGGLCVRFKGKHPPAGDEPHEITLESDGGSVTCMAKVAWVRRVGFRSYLVGFEFLDKEVAQRINLFRLAWDPYDPSVMSWE